MKYSPKPIAFRPEWVEFFGDVETAIFFQQIHYWSDKGGRNDGFIYKTQDEIEYETTLTRFQQDRVRKKLVTKGLLEVKKVKANGVPTLHYKLTELANGFVRNSQFSFVRNSQMDLHETYKSLTESTNREYTESNNSKPPKKVKTPLTPETIKSHTLFAEAVKNFPYRNYDFEIKKMFDWWNTNKGKPPTNFTAFTNWLSNAKEDPKLRDLHSQQIREEIRLKEQAKPIEKIDPETTKAVRDKIKQFSKGFGNIN